MVVVLIVGGEFETLLGMGGETCDVVVGEEGKGAGLGTGAAGLAVVLAVEVTV